MAASEPDFMPVLADVFDSPMPSPTALAEFALQRSAMVLGEPYTPIPFGSPGVSDFLSLAALHTRGYVYTVQSDSPLPWSSLPIHTVQTAGNTDSYCYGGVCVAGRPELSAPKISAHRQKSRTLREVNTLKTRL